MSEATPSAVLNLDQQRVFVLHGNAGRKYTITCRRVTRADWAAYYAAQTTTVKREGSETTQEIDVESSHRLLAERVIVAAAGYVVAGDVELQSLPNWQTRLPLAHRLQVGRLLGSVSPSAGQGDELIRPEGEVVLLDAMWSVGEHSDQVQVFKELKHVLASPTEKQYQRYARESSRAVILGGSRTGITRYPSCQPILVALYDEMIQSVEGYAVNAQPLEGREQIVAEMDSHHKFFAALQVFQPVSTVLVDAMKQGEAE